MFLRFVLVMTLQAFFSVRRLNNTESGVLGNGVLLDCVADQAGNLPAGCANTETANGNADGSSKPSFPWAQILLERVLR